MNAKTGRCLCGAVAYETAGEPVMSALCHCPSCRRAAGSPAVAWAMFPRDKLTMQGEEPSVYASSPGVRRSFCGKCGTPLFFEADYIPGLVDVTIASFDAPEEVPPQMHIWNRYRLGWMNRVDALETYEELPPTS